MRILLTGAGGNLGRVTAPALADQGHTPVLFDFRELDTPYELVNGDIRNLEDIRRAVDGVDTIVHAAALHGIHLNSWQPHDYWAINVTGTFNIYEAARMAGIGHIVLASTMAVYGRSSEPPVDSWGMVTETSALLPNDVSGMSKLLCEHLAQEYAREWEIETVALRLGMFVPETFVRYGFRLVFGGVDDRDVAQAVLLALNHRPQAKFDAVNIFSDVPFDLRDARELATNPNSVLERYWPGVTAVIDAKQLNLGDLLWGRCIWPPDKAKRVLGFRPHFTFAQFLEALRHDNPAHYPYAELPHWGINP